jgi:hypothetical protein
MTLCASYTIKFAGDLANRLTALGYSVTGQSVGAASRSEALRLVRSVLGDAIVTFRTDDGDGDFTYCYRDREAADGDDTGAAAQAVVSYVEAEVEEV